MNRIETSAAAIAGVILFCLLCLGVAKFGEATGWKPQPTPTEQQRPGVK